jgi:hypothetical protein
VKPEDWQKKLAPLRKRRDWLLERLARAEGSGRSLSFDRTELAALEWALTELEQLGAIRCQNNLTA